MSIPAWILQNLSFVAECCFKCQVPFALEREHQTKLRNSHQTFYCPNGHAQHYTGSSDLEKERQARQRAEQRLAEEREATLAAQRRADHQERRASTFKGHCTRIRKKVKLGKCPCCDGEFRNLRHHMQRLHPDWTPDAEPAE